MARRSEGGAGRPAAGRSSAPSRPASAGLNPQIAGAAFALLRIFVGLMFLTSGIEKWEWFQKAYMVTAARNTAAILQGTALQGGSPFLKQVVATHSMLFTCLVVGGEILIGVLLTLGLFSRAAALYALGLNLVYLAAYWRSGSHWQMLNEAFVVLEVAFLMVGPGRTFGLDARFARKRPGWILW